MKIALTLAKWRAFAPRICEFSKKHPRGGGDAKAKIFPFCTTRGRAGAASSSMGCAISEQFRFCTGAVFIFEAPSSPNIRGAASRLRPWRASGGRRARSSAGRYRLPATTGEAAEAIQRLPSGLAESLRSLRGGGRPTAARLVGRPARRSGGEASAGRLRVGGGGEVGWGHGRTSAPATLARRIGGEQWGTRVTAAGYLASPAFPKRERHGEHVEHVVAARQGGGGLFPAFPAPAGHGEQAEPEEAPVCSPCSPRFPTPGVKSAPGPLMPRPRGWCRG